MKKIILFLFFLSVFLILHSCEKEKFDLYFGNSIETRNTNLESGDVFTRLETHDIELTFSKGGTSTDIEIAMKICHENDGLLSLKLTGNKDSKDVYTINLLRESQLIPNQRIEIEGRATFNRESKTWTLDLIERRISLSGADIGNTIYSSNHLIETNSVSSSVRFSC